jgi:hypothetical protein
MFLQLEQTDHRWQSLKEREKDRYDDEEARNFSVRYIFLCDFIDFHWYQCQVFIGTILL